MRQKCTMRLAEVAARSGLPGMGERAIKLPCNKKKDIRHTMPG